MKTYIFADRTSKMNHFEIVAASLSEAMRLLISRHGRQPYRIVNIVAYADAFAVRLQREKYRDMALATFKEIAAMKD